MKRWRWLLFALGFLVPSLALSVGWLLEMRSLDEARRQERKAQLMRQVDAVRAAVDSSLEELRAREDARPFYLYNHYYSPLDVIAINQPIAISPLASAPGDPRVVGYFHVDPDGTLRTPYGQEVPEEKSRADRIVAFARSPAVADIRDMHREGPALGLVAVQDPTPIQKIPAPLPIVRRGAKKPVEPVDQNTADVVATLDPQWQQVPLQSYRVASSQVVNNVYQAQQGNLAARRELDKKGQVIPVTRRRDTVSKQTKAQATGARSSKDAARALRRRRERERLRSRLLAANKLRQRARQDLSQQREIVVDYTPMAWHHRENDVLLARTVSHDGAVAVQSVILDRDHIDRVWVPDTVARFAVEGAKYLDVIDSSSDVACSIRAPLSSVIHDRDLCFQPAAMAATASALGWQYGLVALLLAAIAVVAWLAYRTMRRAEELAEHKSSFVSAVSHELRTPLTTLRMHAEMLRDKLVSPARLARVHGELVSESLRLSRLVDNVLHFAKVEAEQALNLQPLALAPLCRDIVASQQALIESAGFEAIVSEDEGDVVQNVDSHAFERMIVNLIENAVKYAKDASTKRIEIVIINEPGTCGVAVRDYGPGIPASERKLVVQKFYRARHPEHRHKPGTGLGLALVQELARSHGARVEIREPTGGGTWVGVLWPQ